MGFYKSFLPLLIIGVVAAESGWYNSTDGRQYLIQTEPKVNWYKAVHECSRRDLQLVEIDTFEKNEALVKMLQSIFDGKARELWLGANDEYNPTVSTNRPFHWTSSGKPMTFSYWYQNEPNNYQSKEHCACTFEGSNDFRWNDRECNTLHYGFICEDRQSYSDFRAAMQERRQRVLKTLKQFYEKYQEEEKNVVEKVHSARDLMVKKNNAIQKFVDDIHTKMSHDFNHGVKLHNREVNNFATDTNQMIRELKEEMQGATEKSYENFSRQFNEVQQNVEDIFEDTDL